MTNRQFWILIIALTVGQYIVQVNTCCDKGEHDAETPAIETTPETEEVADLQPLDPPEPEKRWAQNLIRVIHYDLETGKPTVQDFNALELPKWVEGKEYALITEYIAADGRHDGSKR